MFEIEDEEHPDAAAVQELGNPTVAPGAFFRVELKDTFAVTGPLGLLGFGLTTILLSFHNVGLYELNSIILGMARVYGGLAQFVAGVFELVKGHTFSGCAFVSYACFWWTLLAIWTSHNEHMAPEGKAMGIFLLFWCIFTVGMFFGTLKSSWSLKGIFGTLAVTFLLLSLGDFTEEEIITNIGGGVGLLCGGLAMYTGLLEVIDHTVGWGKGLY
jgi:succinate-acetate transporter protein